MKVAAGVELSALLEGEKKRQPPPDPLQDAFRDLYERHLPELLRYSLRRVADPGDAADVVAETFLVAWRRLDEIPAGTEATLWLYGVARRVLSNHRRAGVRRIRLAERPRAELGEASIEHGELQETQPVTDALNRLSPGDRELLLLTNWEGLTPLQIAATLEISPVAARARLSRARKRLKADLDSAGRPGGIRV